MYTLLQALQGLANHLGWDGLGHIWCMRWKRSTYKAVAGTPDLQIPLRNPRCKCEGNI